MKLLLILLSLSILASCQSGNDSSDMVSSRRRVSEEDEVLARNSSVIDVKASTLTINSTVNNFNFRLIFNKIVNVNGCVPTVEIVIGSTSYTASYLSGSGSTEHTFNVAFPNELDLNGPQVVGRIGAPADCLIDIKNKNTILTFPNKVISNVTIDQIGPTVSSFSINPSGSISVGDILTIRANFNESVVINTSTSLAFSLGGSARSASFHSTNGSSQLIFRYTIQGGDVGSQTLSISSLPTNIEDNVSNSASGVTTPFSELINVTIPNTVPVANNITPANFNEDTQSIITLSYTDANGDLASSCALSALSNVTVSSPCSCAAGLCTVGITGTANFNGSGSFSYTVIANGDTSNSANASLTINPINDAPTISNIANQSTNEDTATGAIAFTIADIDSTLNCTTAVSGTSSNSSLVTNGAISILGTAPNCTVTLTPVADATGTSTITLTVTDGSLTVQDSFVLTVNGTNDAPTISNVANQATNEDTALNSVAVTINDPDSTLNCATSLSGTSSNTSVITNGGITFGGTAPNCTVSFASVANASGAATITLTVSDGTFSAQDTLLLTVNPINDAPTISNIANQSTNEDTATGAIDFIIADIDSTLNCATAVSGTSSDTGVVTNGAINIEGTAPNCTVTLTPVADATGTSTITLSVSDGGLTAQDSFVLTVNGTNDAPTISNVTDQATNEDTSLNSVAVTLNDIDSTLNCATALSGTSSNTGLITNGGVTFGGTYPNCTVNFAPVANANGAATITLTVSDGTLSAQDTLVLTVNPINDAPVISAIGNQMLDEDIASSALAFSISDVDNNLNCSTSMAKSSSVTSVIANAGIVFAGTAPNCTVTLTPVNNSSGNTTVTLTVSDGLLDASTNFNVTVDPLPDLLSVTEPVNNTYGLGSSITFELAYDTNTIVLGTPRLVLNIGGITRYANMTTGNGSSTLIFTYIVTAGENDNDGISANTTLDLNGGSILSSSGDAFPLDISGQLSSLTNVLVNTSLAPPGQVTSVTQTNLSIDSTQATFIWTAPAPGGAPITEYIVQYRVVGTVPFTTLSPNPTTTSATLTGLIVNTNYQVRVAAYNGVIGASSNLLSFTTFFNPKSLGALVWYEARDINGTGMVPADGASINTLVDKSGRNNNASLKGGETAGVIQTSGGRKVLRVSNANYQTINSLGETGNAHLEVYLIAKANSTPNSFVFCNENCTTLAARFGSHFPWSDGNAYVDLPGANRIQTPWGGNTTNFFAWTFRSSTTNGRVLERNGVPIITQTNRTDSTRLLKKWNFFGNATNGENCDADFVAVFVFDKILTPGQRQLFFDYIETNYSVVMP